MLDHKKGGCIAGGMPETKFWARRGTPTAELMMLYLSDEARQVAPTAGSFG